jgi:archaellum component FlaC|tara:strand:- start:14000 stop:14314 length:315 start_codon:yes stop_codon:yes gene_type:complete
MSEEKKDSNLGIEALKNRVKKLESDVKNVTTQINDLEKKKIEAIAMLNALQGAKQQCQMFLQEINNDDSGSTSSTGDLGSLGGPPPTEEELAIQKAKDAGKANQ